MDQCRSRNEFKDVIERYVKFYNEQRPCFAIGYDTPSNYRKRHYKGELEQKNTFADRIISEVPKFVQKRLEKAHCAAVQRDFVQIYSATFTSFHLCTLCLVESAYR